MRRVCVVLICFAIAGCSIWQDKTVKEVASLAKETDVSTKGDLKTQYPQPSKQDVVVTASGNANVSVTIPDQKNAGTVTLSNKTDQQIETEVTFSLDRYIRQVSLSGWFAILLVLLLLFLTFIYFLKRTMVGRAADAGIAAGIDATTRVIADLTEKVLHTDPSTESWRQFNEMRNMHQDKLAELLRRSRR